MPQYLLSVHHREGEPTLTEQEQTKLIAQVDRFNEEVQDAQRWVFAGGLCAPDTATIVHPSDAAELLLTDGPFIEAKEYLGGFWIIEVEDLDQALSWAQRAARACQSPVEVRPFQG